MLRRAAPHARWLVPAGALALLGACTVIIQFDPAALREETPDRCQDGVDNDENGLTDCAEPGCQIFTFCQERTEAACRDRNDNDRDGLIDCLDPDCQGYARCNEALQSACTDGQDNNGDGLADCGDFTCLQDPHCCSFVAQLWDDPLAAGQAAAAVQTCDASQSGSQVNGFDPEQWAAFGVPAPRPAGDASGLDPNQCAACFSAGLCRVCGDAVLLAQDTQVLRPGLALSAWLRVSAEPTARAGVAWTEQALANEAQPCAGDAPLVDRRVGIHLEPDPSHPGASRAFFVVENATVGEAPWPTQRVRATVLVDPDGFARFYLGAPDDPLPELDTLEDFRSPRALDLDGPPVRVAVHGRGEGLRVERVVVRDQGRCFDPSLAAPQGPTGPIRLGQGTGWDRGMVSDPAVFWWHSALHLLYVGRAAPYEAGAIGHAVATSEASPFVRRTVDTPLIEGSQVAAWLSERLPGWTPPEMVDLSGPAVLVRSAPAGGALRVYLTVTERQGDEVLASWILGLETDDLITFSPLSRQGTDPHTGMVGETLSLLSGADPDAGTWERGVGAPAVVERGPGDYVMFYSGRSDPADPFTSSIGVALSQDGVHWTGAHKDGSPEHRRIAALTPPTDSLIYTGLSDPTAVWDPRLGIFRLWYVERRADIFSIRYAQANRDVSAVVDYPGNPVLLPPPGPSCDDQYLDGPSVLHEPSGRVSLFYHGKSSHPAHSICYAETPGYW